MVPRLRANSLTIRDQLIATRLVMIVETGTTMRYRPRLQAIKPQKPLLRPLSQPLKPSGRPHGHSARVSAAQSRDPGYSSPKDAV